MTHLRMAAPPFATGYHGLASSSQAERFSGVLPPAIEWALLEVSARPSSMVQPGADSSRSSNDRERTLAARARRTRRYDNDQGHAGCIVRRHLATARVGAPRRG